MNPARLRKSGFTLLELLISLIILVIFFDIAGRLFRSTVQLSSASENLSDTSSRIDWVVHQLRTDVWNSKSISVAPVNSVNLTLADGSQISWTFNSTDGVTRTAGASPKENWNTIGTDWTASIDGVSLTITEKSDVPVRMISQILLAERMRP